MGVVAEWARGRRSCDRGVRSWREGVAAAMGVSQLQWGCRSGDRGVARLPDGVVAAAMGSSHQNPIGIRRGCGVWSRWSVSWVVGWFLVLNTEPS
jgi:hypothetical protein